MPKPYFRHKTYCGPWRCAKRTGNCTSTCYNGYDVAARGILKPPREGYSGWQVWLTTREFGRYPKLLADRVATKSEAQRIARQGLREHFARLGRELE
jgi:hypothetical protein